MTSHDPHDKARQLTSKDGQRAQRFSRRAFLAGLGACAAAGCDRFDALSWVSRARYDVDRRFRESREQLADPPPPQLADPERWSMFLIGDLHCWDAIPNTMGAVRRYLWENPVDFVFHLGDLADRGYSQDHETGRQALEFLGLPFYSALGNHDTFNEGWSHFRWTIGPSMFSMPVGNATLVTMDTAGGTLGGLQRPWVEEQLAAATTRHLFVMTHYPIWPGSSPGGLTMGSQEEVYDLLDLFRTFGVTAHFSGHSHLWGRTQLDDVELITVSSMKEASPDRCGLRVEVSGGRVTYERVAFGDHV